MLPRSSGSRYAKALFELAREARLDAEIEAALLELSQALQDAPQTQRLLTDPRLSLAQKREIFSRVLAHASAQASALLLNFLSVLFEKNRFHLIHDVALSFKTIADEAQGESVAVVRSARTLDAADEASLLTMLEKYTGTKVAMKKEVDASVLGGVEVRIGNRVIDGTVRGNLERLKEELLKRH